MNEREQCQALRAACRRLLRYDGIDAERVRQAVDTIHEILGEWQQAEDDALDECRSGFSPTAPLQETPMPSATHPLIAAGHALAELARKIAEEDRRASGYRMAGAHAEALAGAWDEAHTRHQMDKAAEELALRGSTTWAVGYQEGHQAGTALRDELLDLARCLRAGFGAALAERTDPDNLTDEEEESLDAARIHIAAASGACARLAQIELEMEGQQRLPTPDQPQRRLGSDFLDQALNEGDGVYRP